MKKTGLILVFAAVAIVVMAAVRKPVYVSATSQMLSGTCVTASDGTVTNTFSTAFGGVPNVVCVATGDGTTTTNTIVITASSFVLRTTKATQTNQWIAIGAAP